MGAPKSAGMFAGIWMLLSFMTTPPRLLSRAPGSSLRYALTCWETENYRSCSVMSNRFSGYFRLFPASSSRGCRGSADEVEELLAVLLELLPADPAHLQQLTGAPW